MTPSNDRVARTASVPIFLNRGFRPFFLGAGLWALCAMAHWLLTLMDIGLALSPWWHQHAMIFGYGGAVVTGFLLTAVPNWTGRLPVAGWPLGALAGLWLLARLCGVLAPPIVFAICDMLFLLIFAALAAREVMAGKNKRNLPVVALLCLFAVAAALSHGENLGFDALDGLGVRLGLAVLLMLIAFIGGRVVPSFTGNWLKKQGAEKLPAPFGVVDKVVLALLGCCLVFWIGLGPLAPVGWLFLLAGGGMAIRIARWRSFATLSEPLVWVMHLGMAWMAVGLLLYGLALSFDLLPVSAGIHALTAGTVGTMTLAIMTRASLGHAGLPLRSNFLTTSCYVLISLAAILRIIADLSQDAALWWSIAGLAWMAAYLVFLVAYAPLLLGWRQKA
jgi:uncharacterized protein involved in response to NO